MQELDLPSSTYGSNIFFLQDRVYVASKDIKLALDTGHPVAPRMELAATERTNAYTVCLTPAGVVGFLNKRISPLGGASSQSLGMGQSFFVFFK